MNMSLTIGQLAEALAAAQMEFPSVKKGSENPYYNSKYADLSAIIGATQPLLAKNGLVIIQSPVVKLDEQKAGVITTLAHKSGEWISDECILPATMEKRDKTIRFDAQSVGSAITYARRYSYQSMIGVAAEIDDDGNKASGVGEGSVQAAQAVATSKLRSKDGNEILIISPYMQGFGALSGSGLSLVRANMDDGMRGKFGWVQKGNVVMVPLEKVSALVDFCTFHSISVQNEVPAAQSKPEPKPNGHAPIIPFSNDGATDPLITEAKTLKSKKNGSDFLVVKWDGHELSLFDKKLFPFIQSHVGKPAMFDWSGNGKYKNILHIVRLGGMDFSMGETVATYQATDADLPY